MVDEGLERYRTARHEGIHALLALAHGHIVSAIDVEAGTTAITWTNSPTDVAHRLRIDREGAINLITGVIAVCCGPAADERCAINQGDRLVIDRWRQFWTST